MQLSNLQKCSYCSRLNSSPLYCSKCNIPYCNIDCQANDWGFHKKYCGKGTPAESDLFSNENLKFSDFEVIKRIGEGNFTSISKVEHIKTGKLFALKIIDRVKMSKLHKEGDVLAEKHSLIKLKESNSIVKIFGTFKESQLLYILQELIHGKELWSHCQYFGICSDILSRYYMYQILLGINEMHKLQIVHRDIKPENIILSNEGNTLKFVDLGSSRDLENPAIRPPISKELKGRVYEHFVGTAQYMAPECMNNKGSDKPCDIWSAGCLFYQLYVGWPPFVGATEYLVFEKSKLGKFIIPDTIPADVSDLIKSMIQLEAGKRPIVEDLLKNKIFDNVRNLKYAPQPKSLVDFAFIKLKEDYVKNANILRVRQENYINIDKKLCESISKIKSMEKILGKMQLDAVLKRVELFKLQMKSLLTDTEFNLY